MMRLESRERWSDWVRCQSYYSNHHTYQLHVRVGVGCYQYLQPWIVHSKLYLLVRCLGALPMYMMPMYYIPKQYNAIIMMIDHTSPMSSSFNISILLIKPFPASAILLSITCGVCNAVGRSVCVESAWCVWPWVMKWRGCVELLWHRLLVRWRHERGPSPMHTYACILSIDWSWVIEWASVLPEPMLL